MIKFYEHGIDWVFQIDDFTQQKYSKRKFVNKLDVIQKFFNDYQDVETIDSVLNNEIYERKNKQENDMKCERLVLEVTSGHYSLYDGDILINKLSKSNYVNRGEYLKAVFSGYESLKEISFPKGKVLYRREQFIKDKKKEVVKTPTTKPPVKLNYILSDKKVLTVYTDGKALVVSPDHVNYKQIIDKVKSGQTNGLYELFNVKRQIEKKVVSNEFTKDKIVIKDGELFFNGKLVNNYLCEQIIYFAKEDLPWDNLANFLERLLKNPHKNVFDELYRFLSNRNMPITEDGCFIGWKKVDDNYKDFYSGTVDNTPGKCPEMSRFEVDDNTRLECSIGLHVGCREYVHNFYTSKGKIVLVKVAPEDVVCVPNNEPTKVRVWKYEVLRDMTENEFLENYNY